MSWNSGSLGKQALAAAGLFLSGAAVGRIARVDRQVSAYRHLWEDHNLATVNWLKNLELRGQEINGDVEAASQVDRPYLIVALGDSATQGIGASHIDQGYLPRLASKIQQVVKRPVAMMNLSNSGGTIETVVSQQVPAAQGMGVVAAGNQPDLVVMNIGGNDVGQESLRTELFSTYLDQIGSFLPQRSLIGNIPSFSFLPQDRRAQELSALIDEMTTTHGHVKIDLRKLTEEYSATEYLLRYHAADLFHPNSRAYTQWADLFFAAWLESNNLAMDSSVIDPDWAQWNLRSCRDSLSLPSFGFHGRLPTEKIVGANNQIHEDDERY